MREFKERRFATAVVLGGGGRKPPLLSEIYLFGFTACLAALLSFFCLAALLAFACFCAACLFLVFGDLSPIAATLADSRVIASFCKASASRPFRPPANYASGGTAFRLRWR